ncbi:MAG: hypothetical protein WA821_10405 [Anaerolineales bacterium]
MAENQSNNFVYESSRHKILMEEYSKLSTDIEYIEWGKRAQVIAEYMGEAIAKVNMAIGFEKNRLEKERDKNARRNIERGLMQYESFSKVVQKQLNDLIKVMDSLPTGPVKPIVKEMDKSRMPTPDSPYVKIFVRKSGDVILDGNTTSMEVLKNVLMALAQRNGVVLYSRESPEDSEPPAIAKTIISLVIENRLPIRMCKNSDFAEAIEPNGKLRMS